jgi:hypothetical protein
MAMHMRCVVKPKSGAIVRKDESTSSPQVCVVPHGSRVSIKQDNGARVLIEFGDQNGWVSMKTLTPCFSQESPPKPKPKQSPPKPKPKQGGFAAFMKSRGAAPADDADAPPPSPEKNPKPVAARPPPSPERPPPSPVVSPPPSQLSDDSSDDEDRAADEASDRLRKMEDGSRPESLSIYDQPVLLDALFGRRDFHSTDAYPGAVGDAKGMEDLGGGLRAVAGAGAGAALVFAPSKTAGRIATAIAKATGCRVIVRCPSRRLSTLAAEAATALDACADGGGGSGVVRVFGSGAGCASAVHVAALLTLRRTASGGRRGRDGLRPPTLGNLVLHDGVGDAKVLVGQGLFGCMAATDPTSIAAKLAFIEAPVCIVWGDARDIDDKLCGPDFAPKHAAACSAALPKMTPCTLVDLNDTPLLDGGGALHAAIRGFLTS